ncbi:MAG: hypothetical protein H8D56_01225 [Planctomycetes bacterium]|nr:hypothetical protein [Planctomycetota bacterium]
MDKTPSGLSRIKHFTGDDVWKCFGICLRIAGGWIIIITGRSSLNYMASAAFATVE